MRIATILLIALSLLVSCTRAPTASDGQAEASTATVNGLLTEITAWRAPVALSLRILPPLADTEIHCKWTIDGATVACDLLLAVPFEHDIWDRARPVAKDFGIRTDKLGIEGSPGMYFYRFTDFESTADVAHLVGVLLREVFLVSDSELIRYYFQ